MNHFRCPPANPTNLRLFKPDRSDLTWRSSLFSYWTDPDAAMSPHLTRLASTAVTAVLAHQAIPSDRPLA